MSWRTCVVAQAPSASPWRSGLGHRSVRSLAATLAPFCSLTTLCTQVVGVELVEPAVVDARANATANGIANARFICSRAAHAMKELVAAASAEMGRIGRESGAVTRLVAIVDPPRAGLMPDTIKYVQGWCLWLQSTTHTHIMHNHRQQPQGVEDLSRATDTRLRVLQPCWLLCS